MKPYKCPVCNGTGTVDAEFYQPKGYTTTANYVTCRSCSGKGVLWSPSEGKLPPVKPEPITPIDIKPIDKSKIWDSSVDYTKPFDPAKPRPMFPAEDTFYIIPKRFYKSDGRKWKVADDNS